jgi:large subunit ribosomal protein L32e
MENKKSKLDLRKDLKKKKYTFVVKESKFSSRVKKRWRFPRGKHSKVRQMHRGRPVLPQPGYGSPKDVKGLHSSGLKPYLLSKLSDLETLDNQVHGIVISSNVGNRKKVTLIETVLEKGFQILNLKDGAKTVKGIKDSFEERKKLKKDKVSKKQKKSEEKKKKAEKKAKEDKEKEKDDNVEVEKGSSKSESKSKDSEKKEDKKDLSEMLDNQKVQEKQTEKTEASSEVKDNKDKVEVKNEQ